MPRYFFALNNEPPENETVEDLPSDVAARKHATKIAIEIWHNGKGEPLPVSTYNERGERLGKTLVIEDGTTVIPLSSSAIFTPPLRRTSNYVGNLRVPVPEKRQGKGEQELTYMHCNEAGPPCMTGSKDYRRYAEECLKIARSVTHERTRAIFSQMAQVWFRLAEEKANSSNEKD
jgi:hypothetical protein